MRATSLRQAPLRSSRWLVALVALLPLLAVVATHAPLARASGCSPCIHWDSNMIFAGLNNGFPEGPVGENATVHGSGFTASQVIGFALVQGDVNHVGNPQQFCDLGTPKVALPGTATADSTGAFTYTFQWPSGAGSNQWSICSYDSGNAAIGSEDDGPFTVLSGSPVMVSLNKPTFQAGETVPVTGLNWLPGGQRPIFVYIGPCVDCGGAPIVSATTTSASDGSFTVNLTIPASAAPGNYLVSANGYTGLLDVGQANSIPVTVTAAAPTATTVAPTATIVPPTATSTTALAAGTHTASGGGGDNTGLLIALIIGLVILFAVLVGLVAYLLTRRKTPAPVTAGPGTPVPVGATPPPLYGYGPPPGNSAPYGIPDYGALPMPDWQDPNAGWDPSATAASHEDALSELYPPRPATPPSPSAPNAGRTTPASGGSETLPAAGDSQARASDPDGQTRASDEPSTS